MVKIYSNVDSTLIHLIHRVEDTGDRKDIVSPDNFIQLATFKLPKNKTFRAHKHLWKKNSKEKIIAQESWVVIKGSVEVFFYDIDGTYIRSEILNQGDCSVTLSGGHNYRILEDDTIVYEYKTGPYNGQQQDKVFIDE